MESNLAIRDDQLELSHLSATICAELAAGLADADGVKEKYGINDAQWRRLKSSPLFRAMLKEALGKFHGDMNAGKRITMKAEILLEDSLPILHRTIHDNDGAIASKLDAVKQLTVLAGKSGNQAGKGGLLGQGFNVIMHINTGGGQDAVPHVLIEQDPEA